jgi:hypothetical protein
MASKPLTICCNTISSWGLLGRDKREKGGGVSIVESVSTSRRAALLPDPPVAEEARGDWDGLSDYLYRRHADPMGARRISQKSRNSLRNE